MVNDRITVEVAYAKPDQQIVIALVIAADSSVAQAIQASGILDQFPEINLSHQKVGIFGQVYALDKAVNDGDRIEIYRPLLQNPMDARRSRLKK